MADVKAKILLDTTQPLGALANLKKALQDLKNMVVQPKVEVPKVDPSQAKEEGIKIGASLSEGVQSGLSRLGQTALGMYIGNLFSQLSSQVVSFAKSIIDASAEVEQLGVSFEVLLGSSEKAQAMLKAIKEYAEKTPYETSQLTKVVQTMLSFGIPAEQVMTNLKALGDVAMGNSEKLQALAYAFSQVQSTGRLTGQDLIQMINAGFNPLLVISQQTGLSIGELKKKMEEGAISADMVRQAFILATSEGGQFFGMTEKQSKTFLGIMSTLQDNIKSFGIALASDIFEKLKGVISDLIDYVGKLKAAFDKAGLYGVFTTIFPPALGATIYGTLKNIVDAVVWLGKTLWNLKPILLFIGGTVGTWMMVTKTIAMVQSAIVGLRTAWMALNLVMASNPILAIASAIIGLAVLIYTYWDGIKSFFANLWDNIVKIFVSAWEWIKGAVQTALQAIFDIITLLNPFGFLVRTMQGDWGVFQGVLDGIKNLFGDTFSKIYETVKDTINGIIRWFTNWWKSVEEGSSIFAGVFRRIREFAEGVAKVVSIVWEKLVEWINKVWGWISGVINKVKEFFGGKKEEVIKVDPAPVQKVTEATKEQTKEVEKTNQKLQSNFELNKKIASEKKKTTQQQTTEAERYVKEKEKELALFQKTKELALLDEEKEKLTIQKQRLDSTIQELQSQSDITKTFEQQKQLLEERANVELQLIQIAYERQILEAKSRLEERLAKENEAYERAVKSAKGNKALLEKLESSYNETIQNIYQEHAETLKKIERQKDNEIIKTKTETNSKLTSLAKKYQDEQRKLIETQNKEILDQILKVQESFADIYKKPEKKITDDVERQIEELDVAFARGEMIEQEYTKRRQELVRKRKAASDEEAEAIKKAYGEAFEKSIELAKQLDTRFVDLETKIADLYIELSGVGSAFAQSLESTSDAFSSFSEYFDNLANKIAEKWDVITQYVVTQTSVMASQMLASGVPALQAFKKAFLVTLLDMTEKLVITQIPAIQALISGSIPFPANLPVIAMLTAMIMTALEVAKAKIRGAEQGYLAGFREGTKGKSDTMLIFINPNEAILPVDVVQRNREALKMMLQGYSFDRQIKQQHLSALLVTLNDRASSFSRSVSKITPSVRLKITNEVDFRPIRLRPNEILINAERYRTKIERLAR